MIKDSTRDISSLRYMLWRLDVKAVAMFLALLLGIAGIVMVYSGFKDEGYIDLKTALVEGKLKSGFVGVVVLFMSVVITLACIVARSIAKPERFELRKGSNSLTWQGDTVNFDHGLAEAFARALNEMNRGDNGTREADIADG